MCQKYMHFRDACQPLTMVRNCYFYTEYYLMLNLLNNINIIKMFHSHIKMYRTLVIWKYASVYIRCLDIVTMCTCIYTILFILLWLYYIFPLRFVPIIWHCILWYYMPLYIMVLPGICRVLFISSFIFFFIFILQCPIMPYK